MTTYIYSWNANSEGATLLKDAMGITKIRNEGSRFVGSLRKRVINWGASTLSREVEKCQLVNSAAAVLLASNKLSFFRKVSEEASEVLPAWTSDMQEAIKWCADGKIVCARTVLNGHSGNGLVIMDRDHPNDFVRAQLYTEYIKKEDEYRIHIVNGRIIDQQRKALTKEKADAGDVNWKIRNLANGFIYQRENVNPPDEVKNVAVIAMRNSGLDFGAVDVVYNSKRKGQKSFVLEINTAPGITGTTVENYARALA